MGGGGHLACLDPDRAENPAVVLDPRGASSTSAPGAGLQGGGVSPDLTLPLAACIHVSPRWSRRRGADPEGVSTQGKAHGVRQGTATIASIHQRPSCWPAPPTPAPPSPREKAPSLSKATGTSEGIQAPCSKFHHCLPEGDWTPASQFPGRRSCSPGYVFQPPLNCD